MNHPRGAGDRQRVLATIEWVYHELVDLGAEFSRTAADLPDDAARAGFPSNPHGEYLAALRLLAVRPPDRFHDEPSAEQRVLKWIGYLVGVAGINAEIDSVSDSAMIAGCAWRCESTEHSTFAIRADDEEVMFRPSFWRGELDLGPIVDAINRLAGKVVLGCGLDNGYWTVFRSTPATDMYMQERRRRAAEHLDELSSEILELYQPYGFFRDLIGLTPSEAAAELSVRVTQRFGVGFYDIDRASAPMMDLLLLLTDDRRSWLVFDAEHRALAATATLDTLESWAVTSNGMIRISNSYVASPTGSRHHVLSAAVNGQPLIAEVKTSKWLQTATIQKAVNDIVKPECEVLTATTGAQDVFAVVADPDLKNLLHSRGLTLQPEFDWNNQIK